MTQGSTGSTPHACVRVPRAMCQLVQVKALIVGLKGVGMEIAKNLTLAGPKQITLFDSASWERVSAGTRRGAC